MQIPTPPGLAGEEEGERQVEQGGAADGSCFSPIQARVGEKDCYAAHHQRDEARCGYPVGHAHESGVPHGQILSRAR